MTTLQEEKVRCSLCSTETKYTRNGASTAMLVDLLRRSGRLEQARKTIAARRSNITGDIIARIPDFQTGLFDKKDLSCHTIEEALKLIELSINRAKLSIQ